MRKFKKWLLGLVAAASSALLLAGCGFPGLSGTSSDTIRIASQNTTEQQIMAYVIQDMIQHYSNLNTTIINNLGSGTVSFNALKNDQADISAIRYTGTDLSTILGEKVDRNNVKATDAKVKRQFNSKYNMHYFPSYGFADTYAFMVTQQTAKKYNLKTVSDMKKVSSKLTVGLDQTWMERKGDGYSAFTKIYGFSFGKTYPMQIGLVYDALEKGSMDAILGYSTDGRISSYNLKILKDDKNFFPPYNASAVATNKVLKQHPQLKSILSRLNGKISLKTMQKLNYQVDNNLVEPEVVAKQFLEKNNYFEGSGK
ncbi:osmoprotectant ABC transporter substrate-binding protein [Lactiplantibacillus fabifermentans]|uniref:Glycine betaine carnitine choline abc transporter, substrate binding protein n=2 Tax=Lactiplantibacillus fabifermentans TaxID=483011 RepID=A0A0R2NPZ9_9LACO|nr:osmoprotectant ABC transporter substrate-binding protein [Lactiplantibacillus fabifermentans]ETY74531.1 glycine/betaine ABC transporter substrate-binding protein [Lactiplantibacillus fabifermentans T30PCM01]KRO27717.1 glycine betaine carnitine choline abc transporter, substrate binding protein [Lactiplantibacillus fabifermentans DSM 21115]